MKWGPVRPARVEFNDEGLPRSPEFGDVYHARSGAFAQARAVFLEGNGLPERWQGRERYVILETGFGLGLNFLATWQAWRDDPRRPSRLFFVSIEGHPVLQADAREAHRRALSTGFHPQLLPHRQITSHLQTPSHLQTLSDELLAHWPPPSPDLHVRHLDDGRVVLMVAHADIAVALRDLDVQADAVFLDGFSPVRNPDMWSTGVFRALARRLAPRATAATWSVAAAVRDGLRRAGFQVEKRPGLADKRERSAAVRERAERVERSPSAPHSPPVISSSPHRPTSALIVGAGLAGAACARALAEAGLEVTVLESDSTPAHGASGNPAGLFHGVVHPEDGAHARWSRAAAWMAEREYRSLIAQGHIEGAVDGLLRREDHLGPADIERQLASLGLPPDGVQARSCADAETAIGAPLQPAPAFWFYPGGGWIDPRTWVAHVLSHPRITVKTHCAVERIERIGGGPRVEWCAQDAQARVVAQSSVAVLCASGRSLTLLPADVAAALPLGLQRGQLTRIPSDTPGMPRLRMPVSGGGYALSLPNGDLLCGATATRHDDEPAVRLEDHNANLERLGRLLQLDEPPDAPLGSPHVTARLTGRVGWRLQADDRLPLVGPCPAWPDSTTPTVGATRAASTRLRDQPVEPGLFLATGLGSRGITWAPLIGRVLASRVTGDPAPVPRSLMEAVDPRRFALRAIRRGKPPGD